MPAPAPLDRVWLEAEVLARLLPGYRGNPGAALAAAAAGLDLGPVPLFDPVWYRARHRLDAGEPAMAHYLASGAASGLDPHPLFSVAHYRTQVPDADPNPLLHFLERGGPDGRDCHPLFASGWYGERNPDVREAGQIPILHYLKHGAGEGRDPHPLFSARFYLAQTDAPEARANPLLHYVRHGEAAGLRPHPSFHPPAVRRLFPAARRLGPLAAYLAVIGPEQPARAAARDAPQPEPPIAPPALPTNRREAGAATLDGVALLRALGLAPDGAVAGPYHLQKLAAIEGDAVAADLAAALAVGPGGPGMTALLAGAGLLPLAEPEPPRAAEDDLAGRHAARLFAAAGRFRLDPGRAGTAPAGPPISILLPVYRPPLHLLERAILSVLCQTNPAWELCIVDDGSAQPGLTAALVRFAAADRRIHLVGLAQNRGIAMASNRALAMASCRHVGLLDHDDMLAADALEQVAARIADAPELDLIYSDECLIDADDLPSRLFSKPDWSPALLTSCMYTGHFSVYRAGLLRELGGFRGRFDLSQDYDLALRVAERGPKVAHIAAPLYGWRTIPGSAASGGKPEARTSNIAALQSALDRRGSGGTALAQPMANQVTRAPAPAPLVSIVIPSDDPALIRQTLMSIAAHTAHPRYELLVVAGRAVIAACRKQVGSRVRFVPFDAAFNFSAKCNAGAAAARGDYLVFCNDDVRVLDENWLDALLDALSLEGVGAAAPKLLYADNTIQHAGMVTGTRRLVGTAFHCFPHASPAHFNLAQSLREVTLLSGACLALPAAAFRAVGGFDAVNTPVAHSDVDLCLRLQEAGWSCVYTPHAALTHFGHVALAAAERDVVVPPDKADLYLLRRFGARLERDPYFPPAMQELLCVGDEAPFHFFAGRSHAGGTASRRGDALLVSHELGASGAPRVVWDMARALRGAGWQVLVLAAADGPFRDALRDLGADVMIDPQALAAGPAVVALGRNFDLVIANTVLSWRLLPALAPFTRVYLYAHETGLAAATAAAEPGFAGALAEASGVWAGSERAAAVLRGLGAAPAVLEYGVEPASAPPRLRGREVEIAVLGAIEPRKGQDLAVKAFPLLPPSLRARCRLRLCGRPHDPDFAQAVAALAGATPGIEIGPALDHDGYREALETADIVLCPSRDDTLPLVSLDALAAGKILVVSREVGTAAYVSDGVSGFVLDANHPAGIAAMLARVLAQRRRWPEIGKAARLLHAAQFSRARFERRLLAMVSAADAVAQAAD